jgi:hypothetical protein
MACCTGALEQLGLTTVARHRMMQLRDAAPTREARARHRLQRQVEELAELLGKTAKDVRAVLRCVDKVRNEPGCKTPAVHVDERWAQTVAAMDDLRRHPVVTDDVAKTALEWADDAYAMLGTLRKPHVVAFAGVLMALCGRTVCDLRDHVAPDLYAGLSY